MTMKPPPPTPQENGSTTPSTPAAAIVASTALPPERRTRIAACVASGSTVAAAPPRPTAVGVLAGAGTAARAGNAATSVMRTARTASAAMRDMNGSSQGLPVGYPGGGRVSRGRARSAAWRSVLPSLPLRRALLRERSDPFVEVLRAEAGLAQRHQLPLHVGVQPRLGLEQLADHALVAREGERRVGGDRRGVGDGALRQLGVGDDLVDHPPLQRDGGADVAAREEQVARPRHPDDVDEAPQAGVRVDEAQLRRRHAELGRLRGEAQVAGERELETAADGVAVEGGDGGIGEAVERLDRIMEGVGDQRLGPVGEIVTPGPPDVVARREHGPLRGQQQAARVVELARRLGDRAEDRVVERVALGRIADREAGDVRRGPVQPQLALGELGGAHSRTTRASPSDTDWPSWHRISATRPSSSASTGISIFIDSRITTVSPSSTVSPTSPSIFQTVPVMWG